MTDEEKIKYLLSKQVTRKALCEHRLDLFAFYYFREFFSYKTEDFHRKWYDMAMSNKNLLVIWFRWSWKTSIFWLIYIIHCIVYKKYDFIVFYCFDAIKARAKTMNIVNLLKMNRFIKEDFWYLFKDAKSATSRKWIDDMQEQKTMEEFITTNWIKVKAMSMWSSPRWEIFINEKEQPIRPQLVLLDDIDIDKSIRNIQVIDWNYSFITWEVMWGIDDAVWKIVFLWNIIWEDWVIPRLKEAQADNPSWIVDDIPLINEAEEILWEDKYVWTDKQAEEENAQIVDRNIKKVSLEDKLRTQWQNAFNSNYRNKPYRIIWDPVFDLWNVSELELLSPITTFNLTAWNKVSKLLIFNNKYKDEPTIVWIDIWAWRQQDFTDMTFLDDKSKLVARWRNNEVDFKYIAAILTEINDRIWIDFYRGWIVVENNNYWHAVIDRLWDNSYLSWLLYRQKQINNINHSTTKILWWGTDTVSKEIMITELSIAIDNKSIQIDKVIKSELNSYIQEKDESSWRISYQAQIKCHDDSVISYALALQGLKSFNY